MVKNKNKRSSKIYLLIAIIAASILAFYNYSNISYIVSYKLLIEPTYSNNFSMQNAAHTSQKDKEKELMIIVNRYFENFPKKLNKELEKLQNNRSFSFSFKTKKIEQEGISIFLEHRNKNIDIAKDNMNEVVKLIKIFTKKESDIFFKSFVMEEIKRRIESSKFHLKFLKDKEEEYFDSGIKSFISQKILNLTENRYFLEQMAIDFQSEKFAEIDSITLQTSKIRQTKTMATIIIIFFTTLASTLGFLYLIRNRKKIIKTLQFD